MENRQILLRGLPGVDEVLQDERLVSFCETVPRPLVVESVREVLERLRKKILQEEVSELPPQKEIMEQVYACLREKKKRGMRRVLNATGVVMHTNLGRARLGREAAAAVREIADTYCTLEYDLKAGSWGSRQEIAERAVRKVTGAEAAMVVNNNAAATMLVLASMARGKEVVVSRGELVEIGGSFRIPDVMSESGAILKEVGTTNKTHLSDYEAAYQEATTGAFMKIHTSNYRIIGFTEDVELKRLAALGRERSVPVIYDMGNGLMTDLRRYGVDEPTVADALEAGADVVLFSGDKLLGGPQAGIITGKKEYVDRMKNHPLARAFRVDKMTLAALEATLTAYLDPEKAMDEIPVLRMIRTPPEILLERANRFLAMLSEICLSFHGQPETCMDQVGGGSAPACQLKGWGAVVWKEDLPAQKLERRLRDAPVPLIVRISHERVLVDMRTLTDEELELAVEAFIFAESGEESCRTLS